MTDRTDLDALVSELNAVPADAETVSFNSVVEVEQLLSSTVGSEAWNSRDLKSRPH